MQRVLYLEPASSIDLKNGVTKSVQQTTHVHFFRDYNFSPSLETARATTRCIYFSNHETFVLPRAAGAINGPTKCSHSRWEPTCIRFTAKETGSQCKRKKEKYKQTNKKARSGERKRLRPYLRGKLELIAYCPFLHRLSLKISKNPSSERASIFLHFFL